MLRKTLTVVAIAASLVACGQQKPAASASAVADASKTEKKDNKPAKLIVAQEDLTTVQSNALASTTLRPFENIPVKVATKPAYLLELPSMNVNHQDANTTPQNSKPNSGILFNILCT